MFIVLFFLLFSAGLQAMEVGEKTPLLAKTNSINGIEKSESENRFQGLLLDVKGEILNALVSFKDENEDEKKSAKGLFSLACTSKKNKKLVDNFCEQSDEAKQLKIKYLKVTERNIGKLWKLAKQLSDAEKIKEYETFMARGIRPSCRENLYDCFLARSYNCCFSVKNDFKERIKKKYALDEDSVFELSPDFNFKRYEERRDRIQGISCCLCCLPCIILSSL